jgi:hypothetical protein
MNAKAAELAEWADLLILAPADAGTLSSMVVGQTTSLALTVLRGWDVAKSTLLVPGMTLAEWRNPMTRRQLDQIQMFWPGLRILPPILSRFEPPNTLKQIPWDGRETFKEEVQKAVKLLFASSSTYNSATGATERVSQSDCESTVLKSNGLQEREQFPCQHSLGEGSSQSRRADMSHKDHILPPELISMVFETLGDWEVAKAAGVYARIPVPEEWKPLLPNPHATSQPISLEYTVLRGSLKEIKEQLSSAPSWKPLSNLTAHLVYKFSRTDILEYLTKSRVDLYCATVRLNDLPCRASCIYGNTAILDWWRNSSVVGPKECSPDAIDSASRAGFVHVLEWWRVSGLPLRYTERSLESASAEGHIPVLDWWKQASESSPDYDPIPLKIGKSVLLAAQSGRTSSLDWWDKSGIPYAHAESVARIASTHGHVPVLKLWHRLKGSKLIFDNQVLVGATKNGHVDVLEWWKRSGLRVEFKTCDIEEALEDAVSGAEERVRRWWEQNGLNLGIETNEWMKVKVL